MYRENTLRMITENHINKLAVLIDADNASAATAAGLFEEISKIGEASVRRIYGDFSGPNLKPWSALLQEHAIIPHQQFAQTKGKNSTDIALVIDAMDLLHSGRFDGFCIVSSDSDFARLAARIREQGLSVYGFGQRKTPNSFRKACHRFIYTENLVPTDQSATDDKTKKKPLQPPSAASRIIKRALRQIETDDGWVALSQVRNHMIQLEPDFDQRTYGFAKFSDLVRKTNAFEIDRQQGGTMRIQEITKPEPASSSKSKK